MGQSIPPATDPRWLSLGPASRVLGVDPDTLRRWADHGEIPVTVTKPVFYDPEGARLHG